MSYTSYVLAYLLVGALALLLVSVLIHCWEDDIDLLDGAVCTVWAVVLWPLCAVGFGLIYALIAWCERQAKREVTR